MEYQRLSEHIVLGDMLRTREPMTWLSDFGPVKGTPCGCALGGAMLSAGKEMLLDKCFEIEEEWKWLEKREAPYGPDFTVRISSLFMEVCHGKMTIEALGEQVREWEEVYDDALIAWKKEQQPEPVSA